MTRENRPAERIDLDLPEHARRNANLGESDLDAEFQSADAGEERADADHGRASIARIHRIATEAICTSSARSLARSLSASAS